MYGRVVLIQGPEDLLADRFVEEAVDKALAEDPEADVSRTQAPEVEGGDLAQMASGSLFATHTVIVIDALADAPDSLNTALVAHVQDPAPEIALVLVHRGGNKNKGLVDKLKKAGAVHLAATALKGNDIVAFVQNEARRRQSRLERHVAQHLVDAVGNDLRALAQAVDQLAQDCEGNEITDELVSTYFQGRAEVKGFAVADAALEGRTGVALEQLRWALDTGTPPVLVTSAVASGLRGLARLSGAGRGSDYDIASDIGVPPWKVRTLRDQLCRWDQDRLARAIVLAARADADTKGGAEDAEYALESMVLQVSRLAAEGRLHRPPSRA